MSNALEKVGFKEGKDFVKFTFIDKNGVSQTIEVNIYDVYDYEIGDFHVVDGHVKHYTWEEKEQLFPSLEERDKEYDKASIINEALDNSDFVDYLIDKFNEEG